ncbi:MAG: divalent-cation tolerance protein CutA [Alphaproteobacteria bacterium]|nr:divalent-cation tolerance protein CutA [Alphaproteobacteria bacterium]
MSEFLMVYVTAANQAEALGIARGLVDAKLAACVNVLGDATSVYRWQGKVEEATEVVLVAKIRGDAFDPVAAKIKSLHSYDVPCIVAYPMAAADAPYLAWLRESTIDPAARLTG